VKLPPAEFDTVVTAHSLIAEDVMRVDLARADGADFPTWDPGSHVDLVLPSGLERQYSLCGQPGQQSEWTIAVLLEREGRGGSKWLHENLDTGTVLRVRGPWNHFGLEPAPHYRFIAAGIGITTILPMIRSLGSRGASWELMYAAKSAERMAFQDEVSELSGGRVRKYLTTEGNRLDIGSLQPAPGELIYACGPARLLDALDERSRDWDSGVLHVERFEAVQPKVAPRNESFAVDLVLSGMTLQVSEDESILAAVERAGVFVLSSCREGTCGTCETAIVSGTAEHRDSILTKAERRANDRMMICVSRAESSPLALEL
jgi:ferredoxin-NADP reductase